MDDNVVDISYLIEGTQEQLLASISYNSNGDDLRKIIFDEECRELVSRYRDLQIFKVRTTVPYHSQIDSPNVF